MNLEKEIYSSMKKYPFMVKVYRKYQELSDKELLNFLEAQESIEMKIIDSPILENILRDYFEIFNLNPVEILEKIEGRTEVEIREDFENLKQKSGKFGQKIENNNTNDEKFKSKIEKENSVVDNFSSYGKDLKI